MYTNIKDGIYKINLTRANPYARYLLVKTYGNDQKQKRMCSLEECKQQLDEWDSDYSRSNPDYNDKGLLGYFGKVKKEKLREYRNYYTVFDKGGNVVMEGDGNQIGEVFGCKSKTVANVANTKGRRLTTTIEGKRNYFDVVKGGQPQTGWVLDGQISW